MSQYTYPVPESGVNRDLLAEQLAAALLTNITLSVTRSGADAGVTIERADRGDLTEAEQTTAGDTIAAHDGAAQTTDQVEAANLQTNWKPVEYITVWKRNIDAAQLGSTLIASVPQSKGPFVVTAVIVRVSDLSAMSTVPTVSLGTNSPTYANLVAATAMTGINALNKLARPNLVAGSGLLAAGADLYANVSLAAVATTYMIDIAVIGFFVRS